MIADIILKSNNVFTGLKDVPEPLFVAIKGNKIIGVGSHNEMDSFIGSYTEVRDYEDQLITAGWCDAEYHFSTAAFVCSDYYLTEIADAKSEEECLEMVKAFNEANPNLDRIVGTGWFPVKWETPELPTKEGLDKLVPDKPVFLMSADGHNWWLNSKAFELCNIPEEVEKAHPHDIKRYENGEFKGIISETLGHLYCDDIANNQISYELAKEVQLDMMNKFASRGLTGFNDVNCYENEQGMDLYKIILEMDEKGELPLRTTLSLGMTPDTDISSYPEYRKKHQSRMALLNTIPMVMDGTTPSHNAALLEPYADKPDTVGRMDNTDEEYTEAIIKANSMGFGVRAHAIGDRCVRLCLDAFEKSNEVNKGKPFRNVIEHIENIHPDDIPRFEELDVVCSIQPVHVALDEDEKIIRLGEERCRYEWPFHSFIESGAVVCMGTDCPVSYFDPFENIYYGVTRNGFDHKPTSANPQEKMTMAECIKGYTYGAAYCVGRETELGTLEKGKLADITVISKNLFEIDPEEIIGTPVSLTMVDGKIIYEG